MLQTIRERFTGVFAVIIIATIAVALTITLVDTDSFTGIGNFAARVDGDELSLAEFRESAQEALLEQEQLQRTQLSDEERLKIERDALEGLVRRMVVARYVNDEGYRVSDARLAEHIRSMPAFQVGGKFSDDGYKAALAGAGVSLDAFQEEQRTALAIDQWQNGLVESSFLTPAEYRRFVMLEGERRRAAFALIDPAQLRAAVPVDEAALRVFYDEHPAQFESRESVALEYVEVKLSEFESATGPTEQELREVYDANPERFSRAEQRRARHILIAIDADRDAAAALARAGDVRARLGKGESFESLAAGFSDDPGSAQSGGDLGWVGSGTFPEPFETALFSLALNQVSEPVQTEFGYHLIELQELRSGAVQGFDEVRGELEQEARNRGSQDRFFAVTEKMDDAALENPGSLEPVAAAAGRPVQRVPGFTRGGAGPFIGNRAVIDAAFSAAAIEDGENSAVLEAGDGHAVILRVSEHRPVRVRPFDEVRLDVEAAYRQERAARVAAEQGAGLLERARAGGDFQTLAAEAGATLVVPTQLLGRGAQEGPPELLAAIFRAQRPASGIPVHAGLSLPDGRFAAYRLEEVVPGNPEDIPREQRDARKAALSRQSAVGEVTALAAELRDAASVVIAPNLFEQQDSE
ncbi:MAG: hypothetical protein FJ197_12150 [Gammaproteobacteria bacterium]|nr:hypothetical protein [Gammaproteobacteria bacterium]